MLLAGQPGAARGRPASTSPSPSTRRGSRSTRTCPPVLVAARRRGELTWTVRNPTDRTRAGRAGRRAGPVAARRPPGGSAARSRPAPRCAARPTLHPSRRGRFEIRGAGRARRGPARARRPPASRSIARRCSGSTPPSRAARRPSCASTGPHPRGRAALGEGPRRRHRVRPAARVRRRRRGPPHRLGGHRPGGQGDGAHLPGRAEPERPPPARQRSRDGRARSPTCRASSTPWTRVHVPHDGRHPPRRPVRAGRLRPRPCGPCCPARSGRDQLGRVAEAMFDLEPVLAESDYRGAFTHALARFRRRSLIVLFTDLVEQAVGESLLPALPLLVRHHVVLVAAVRDPDVVALGHRAARRRRRGLPRRRGHAWPSPSATAPPPASAASAPSSSTRPPASSPPASPTPTSTSRPAAACSARRRSTARLRAVALGGVAAPSTGTARPSVRLGRPVRSTYAATGAATMPLPARAGGLAGSLRSRLLVLAEGAGVALRRRRGGRGRRRRSRRRGRRRRRWRPASTWAGRWG